MEAGGVEGRPGTMDGGEGGRERGYRMGRRRIGSLETRVTRECSISRGGQIVQWRYTCRRSPRRESQCYGRGSSSKSESCLEL